MIVRWTIFAFSVVLLAAGVLPLVDDGLHWGLGIVLILLGVYGWLSPRRPA